MAPTPVFLPGEVHGQRSLTGYSPCVLQRVGHDWVTKTHVHYIIKKVKVFETGRKYLYISYLVKDFCLEYLKKFNNVRTKIN